MNFLKFHRELWNSERKMGQKGFSLLEILIALTLLALVGTYAGLEFYRQYDEGRVKAASILINSVAGHLKEFRRLCGYYPTTDQGLNALYEKPTSGRECPDYPPEGIVEKEIELDPWKNDLFYESDGKKFTLKSFGADKEEGGEGVDADIEYGQSKRKKRAESTSEEN